MSRKNARRKLFKGPWTLTFTDVTDVGPTRVRLAFTVEGFKSIHEIAAVFDLRKDEEVQWLYSLGVGAGVPLDAEKGFETSTLLGKTLTGCWCYSIRYNRWDILHKASIEKMESTTE